MAQSLVKVKQVSRQANKAIQGKGYNLNGGRMFNAFKKHYMNVACAYISLTDPFSGI